MINRPTLPELPYVLWLPELGTYVRKTRRMNRRFNGTPNRENAVQLPYGNARAVALGLIRSTGLVVELRDVQPGGTA